jgi:hypothetical protein
MNSEQRKVSNAEVAKEIALRACRDIGSSYPSSSDIDSIRQVGNNWVIKANYIDETLTIEIDAKSGDVLSFNRVKSQ